MKSNNTPEQKQKEFDFLLVEYKALRDEILRRIVLKHQLFALALIGIGSFLPFSIQITGIPSIVLTYPILAMFIATAWYHNEVRIRQTARYVKAIEAKFFKGKIGWEHIRQSEIEGENKFGSHSMWAARGIFIGTQVIALILGWIKTSYPTEDIVLLAIDVVAIIITGFLLRKYELNISIKL